MYSYTKPVSSIRKLPGGFYAIVEPKHTIIVGVAGGELVAGNATPAALRSFAAAPPTTAVGAQGTVAFRIALQQLLALTLHHGVPSIARSVLNQLGDVTGWASASPSGRRGPSGGTSRSAAARRSGRAPACAARRGDAVEGTARQRADRRARTTGPGSRTRRSVGRDCGSRSPRGRAETGAGSRARSP